jgi:hypothetical protein
MFPPVGVTKQIERRAAGGELRLEEDLRRVRTRRSRRAYIPDQIRYALTAGTREKASDGTSCWPYDPKCMMLFGDTRESLHKLFAALKW